MSESGVGVSPVESWVSQNFVVPVILAVGDTTFLDYKNIKAKRDGYGPIGNGGNGLILHTTLAVKPEQG